MDYLLHNHLLFGPFIHSTIQRQLVLIYLMLFQCVCVWTKSVLGKWWSTLEVLRVTNALGVFLFYSHFFFALCLFIFLHGTHTPCCCRLPINNHHHFQRDTIILNVKNGCNCDNGPMAVHILWSRYGNFNRPIDDAEKIAK